MMRRMIGNQNEMVARNRSIYESRESGEMIIELSKEYNLSVPRIHRICLQEEVKDLREKNIILENRANSCENKLKYISEKK